MMNSYVKLEISHKLKKIGEHNIVLLASNELVTLMICTTLTLRNGAITYKFRKLGLTRDKMLNRFWGCHSHPIEGGAFCIRVWGRGVCPNVKNFKFWSSSMTSPLLKSCFWQRKDV